MQKITVLLLFLTLISCKFDRKKAILSVELVSNSQTIENHFSSESNPTNPETVATPTFSPSGGTYNSDQSITISTTTAGASIYYTTDGTNPSTSSNLYTAPISISGHGTIQTIKAIAVKSGMLDSSIASDTWNILYETVATPTFSPSGGTYNSDQSITISTTTAGASIYYTTDGTNPSTSSNLYIAPISIAGHGTTQTIKAIAIKSGMLDSSIASDTWNILYETVATPTFSPSAGHYSSPQTITISTSTTGATIYYTIDGSTPTTSSLLYSGGFSMWSVAGRTIKAFAIKTGMLDSSVATISYSFLPFKTNRTGCWNLSGASISCSGTGQDGEFQYGVSQSYSVSGQIVTDNVTGLVWQRCSAGQTGASCVGTANTYTWVNAQNYCNTLTLGGRTWRLPNINELYSLVHKKKTSLPLIDETYFPNNLGLVHWSSTTSLYNSSYAVGVSFLFGNVTTWAPKLGTMVDPMVRCVSGP